MKSSLVSSIPLLVSIGARRARMRLRIPSCPVATRYPSRCIAEDFLTTPVSGLRRAKSSRERAEGSRERPKRRGRARATMWRRHDDRSAVSVTATVVRRGCAADFQVGIRRWDSRSFFFFSSYFSFSLSRPTLPWRLSNSPQGRRRWRRFPVLARDVKTIVRNARVRNVPRFVSVKGNAISSG